MRRAAETGWLERVVVEGSVWVCGAAGRAGHQILIPGFAAAPASGPIEGIEGKSRLTAIGLDLRRAGLKGVA
jgi:hypothetical protein